VTAGATGAGTTTAGTTGAGATATGAGATAADATLLHGPVRVSCPSMILTGPVHLIVMVVIVSCCESATVASNRTKDHQAISAVQCLPVMSS
jgi:hypothetical protein